MEYRNKRIQDICKDNSMPFPLASNIVEEEDMVNSIRSLVTILAKALSGSLGPYGSSTVIQGVAKDHYATKDGLNILNSIAFQDSLSSTVLDSIKDIAKTQALLVGDGTTSAVVIAATLYLNLTSFNKNAAIFKKIAPKDILDMLSDLSTELEKLLRSNAVPVSEDLSEIKTLATISTNNDSLAGEIIYETYKKIGKYGFIDHDISENVDVDYVEYVDGVEWSRGYVDNVFGNGFKNSTVEYQNPYVFICNGSLTVEDLSDLVIPIIQKVCLSKETNNTKDELIIVTNALSGSAVSETFKSFRMRHKGIQKFPEIKFTVVDIDQMSEASINTLVDLSILCGCDIYDKFVYKLDFAKNNLDLFIGRAKKATITARSTQIICDKTISDNIEKYRIMKENIVKECFEIIKNIEDQNTDNVYNTENFNSFLAKKRLSELTSLTAVYHVGGKTLNERKTRDQLIEDAILSSRSAMKYGYIPGGNIMIPYLIDNNIDYLNEILRKKYSYLPLTDLNKISTELIKLFKDTFLESYRQVLKNSYLTDDKIEDTLRECLSKREFYNLKSHKFEKFESTSVINSVDTDIEIMKSCVSIMGLLALSNQFVTLYSNVNGLRN